MSVTAHNPVSYLPNLRLRERLAHAFTRKVDQGRQYGDLRDLPDYLLLDIGVDPRDVKNGRLELIDRPDMLHHGSTTFEFRTTAKS